MKFENTGNKIINLGKQVVLPGESIEIPDKFAKNGVISILKKKGDLKERTSSLPSDAKKSPKKNPKTKPKAKDDSVDDTVNTENTDDNATPDSSDPFTPTDDVNGQVQSPLS